MKRLFLEIKQFHRYKRNFSVLRAPTCPYPCETPHTSDGAHAPRRAHSAQSTRDGPCRAGVKREGKARASAKAVSDLRSYMCVQRAPDRDRLPTDAALSRTPLPCNRGAHTLAAGERRRQSPSMRYVHRYAPPRPTVSSVSMYLCSSPAVSSVLSVATHGKGSCMAPAVRCPSYSPTGLNRRRLGTGMTSWLESSSSDGSS